VKPIDTSFYSCFLRGVYDLQLFQIVHSDDLSFSEVKTVTFILKLCDGSFFINCAIKAKILIKIQNGLK